MWTNSRCFVSSGSGGMPLLWEETERGGHTVWQSLGRRSVRQGGGGWTTSRAGGWGEEGRELQVEKWGEVGRGDWVMREGEWGESDEEGGEREEGKGEEWGEGEEWGIEWGVFEFVKEFRWICEEEWGIINLFDGMKESNECFLNYYIS